MPNLKAVDVDKLDALIADIANATREKTGKTDLIPDNEIASEIRSIETGGGDDLYRQMIDGSYSGEPIFPEGITTIGQYAFSGRNITKAVIPDSVTSLGQRAFQGCSKLTEIVYGKGITSIPYQFTNGAKIREQIIPRNVTTLNNYAVEGNTNLYRIYLPNTITKIGSGNFQGRFDSLELFELEEGFNCNINVSYVTQYFHKLTAEVLVAMFEALKDLTGQTAKKITLGTKLLALLTEEQIAIATEKNWTVA